MDRLGSGYYTEVVTMKRSLISLAIVVSMLFGLETGNGFSQTRQLAQFTRVPELPKRLEAYRTWQPTSTPSWSSERTTEFVDLHGNKIRMFNGTNGRCMVDMNLLRELTVFGGTAGTAIQHKKERPIRLELRYLPNKYLVPLSKSASTFFTTSERRGLVGLTSFSPYLVVAAMGVGTMVQEKGSTPILYNDPGEIPTIKATWSELPTLHTISLFIVYGYNRAMKVPRRPKEERRIELWFTKLLFEKLAGRQIVKCNAK